MYDKYAGAGFSKRNFFGRQILFTNFVARNMIERLSGKVRSVVRLSDEEANIFKLYWKERTINKHDFLVRNGEICRYDTYILNGTFKCYAINPDTGRHQINFLAIDDWWATDLSSFHNATASIYNIQALEDSLVLQITKDGFDSLVREIPSVETYFRIILQNYTVSLQRQIHRLTALSAFDRYTLFVEQYPEINHRVPQYLIASYLGISPELLSKIRTGKHR